MPVPKPGKERRRAAVVGNASITKRRQETAQSLRDQIKGQKLLNQLNNLVFMSNSRIKAMGLNVWRARCRETREMLAYVMPTLRQVEHTGQVDHTHTPQQRVSDASARRLESLKTGDVIDGVLLPTTTRLDSTGGSE